jgi:hypothetical protein
MGDGLAGAVGTEDVLVWEATGLVVSASRMRAVRTAATICKAWQHAIALCDGASSDQQRVNLFHSWNGI